MTTTEQPDQKFSSADEIAKTLLQKHPNWNASQNELKNTILASPKDSGTDEAPVYDVQKTMKNMEKMSERWEKAA
jgi:hypothetical protein